MRAWNVQGGIADNSVVGACGYVHAVRAHVLCAFMRATRRARHAAPTFNRPLECAHMFRPAFLLLPLALAACGTQQLARVEPIDGVISGQCHVDRVRGAVGLAASATTIERARVDSDSLEVRVLRSDRTDSGGTASGAGNPVPGAESGGERLTIEHGRTNNITAIYCG